ncbi:MAG: type III-A CRISPR-associated RAMP protein Csm3 [Candidatus Aenigmatarchaeota archaeon]|nr:type III-A CRISPR-associated RAMP protein Csm3 [Methanothermobacter sp.]
MEDVNLLGKVIIRGGIVAITGLHIGGSQVKLEIGGVDTPIIRDAVTNEPYIPGSSLKGKMRSLLEKAEGKKQNQKVGRGVKIHICDNKEDYSNCKVCKIFGTPGEKNFSEPTRLIVRDAQLTKESAKLLKGLELPYSEVKFENVIDRITSAANPRQIERVPAGAKFNFEIIYNIFTEEDKDNLKYVFKAMKLLEHDYLGGQGSRGYGKIKFEKMKVYWNSKNDYETGNVDIKTKAAINENYFNPSDLINNFDKIKTKIQ